MLTVWPAIVSTASRPVVDAAFDCTVTPIVPLPELDVGATVTQAALLDAVHAQFDPFAVMPICPTPPVDPYGDPSSDVSIVRLHASASCVTWNGCPPIVTVPTRGTVVEFGSTEYSSVPDAVPDPP